MPHRQPIPLDLSEAELRLLETYAQQHNKTLDEAATELARVSLRKRVEIPRLPSSVVPFRKR